jgi:hypothetical protein
MREPLRMARNLDPYRETARMALEPWLVEAALATTPCARLAQRRAGSLDGFADTLDLVARQIVHHDNVAPPQCRNEELLDPGEECLAVHRAVEDARRGHAVLAQSSDEGGCFQWPCGTVQTSRLPRAQRP